LSKALKRFQEGQPYATYCGRLVAELLLRMQRPDDAHKVFERLAQAKGSVWARLGMARALVALGDMASAKKLIAAVLSDDPGCADAYDLMGRILVEQCDFTGALDRYREAASITPGCLLRTQHAGALAFYQGQNAEASKTLERAVGLGVQSKLFDALTLLLIAVLRLDNADKPGVMSMRDQLQRYRERFPASKRLVRFSKAVEVLSALVNGQVEAALAVLRELTAQSMDNDFDLEAANTVLLLWARIPPALRAPAEHEAAVEKVAMRFAVSKAIAEVLVASGRREEPTQGVVRRCQARITALTEKAMDDALKGHADKAVRNLLSAGEECLNAKLLEVAALMARRHQALVPEAEFLAERASQLVARSSQSVNHIAGIQRSGRSPGGLQLRLRQPEPNDVATA
jgi:predicted Zn-dependent protease